MSQLQTCATAEVHVRVLCEDCNGTGKAMSLAEAKQRAHQHNEAASACARPNYLDASYFETCRKCKGKGLAEKWMSIEEFNQLNKREKSNETRQQQLPLCDPVGGGPDDYGQGDSVPAAGKASRSLDTKSLSERSHFGRSLGRRSGL